MKEAAQTQIAAAASICRCGCNTVEYCVRVLFCSPALSGRQHLEGQSSPPWSGSAAGRSELVGLLTQQSIPASLLLRTNVRREIANLHLLQDTVLEPGQEKWLNVEPTRMKLASDSRLDFEPFALLGRRKANCREDRDKHATMSSSSARLMLHQISVLPSRWVAGRRFRGVGAFYCKPVGYRSQKQAAYRLDRTLPFRRPALPSTPRRVFNHFPVQVSSNSERSVIFGNLRAASNAVAGPSTGSDDGQGETVPGRLSGRIIHREAVIKCQGITAVRWHCGNLSLRTPFS